MTKAGAATKKNSPNAEPAVGKRRGARCHFAGDQWDFLAGKSPQFYLAKDNKTQGAFYKMAGREFVCQWGIPKIVAGEDDEDEDEEDRIDAAIDNALIAAAADNIDPALRGTASEVQANESSKDFNAFVKVNTSLLLYVNGR